ncbi:acyltransferase family protein [Georgenia yuyongxinii]|uniref:Acyltransferase n=1 Tax=Georgenia yuyongxinii TaxID=2589797 RepID=A0A552WLB2_9MICO|nr:acyltransferase family protein [Georgenia yuyongxinii]TRW43558.1 acyltransferase [Georgenia yuyongxinii]
MTTQVRQDRDKSASGTTAGSAPDGRIEGLDGLRAIAVAAVLVFHLRPASLPGGYLGVDMFFVVSGFLITTLLLRELATRHRIDLPKFWLRRARRLLPALVTVVVTTVPLAWLAERDLLVGVARQTLGALTFSSNWLEVAAGSSYFTATSPQLFVNFWSLAVEEQFYLLWPLALVVIVAAVPPARSRAMVALGVGAGSAVLMAVLHEPGQDATRVYYGTDTHLFGLMLGAALAFAWAAPGGGPVGTARWRRWRGPSTLVALGGLLALMLTLDQGATWTFRGGIVLAAVFTALLVAALLGPAGPFQRFLRARPLEWLGQRSYAVYLWHWPVILIVGELVPTAQDSAGHWLVRGAALTITLALAAVSFRLVEQPVRSLGFRGTWSRARAALTSRLPGRRVLARIVTGAAALAVVATVAAVAVAPERSRTHEQLLAGQERVEESAERAEVVTPSPATDFSMPTGEEITGFGDSIVVTSADGLEVRFPGLMLDAVSNRQWPDAETAVRDRLADGTVRRAVFLDFGTNAGVKDEALVRRVLDALGSDRLIVVVNLYGGSYWVPEANATLAGIVAGYPNAIVADWHGAISAHPELLQSDGIHPDLDGAYLYADVVAGAFAELSERLTGVPVEEVTPSGTGDAGTSAQATAVTAP